MNNRRKLVIALGLCALDPSLSAFAQKQDKVRRIGFLAVRPRSTPSSPDVLYDAFVWRMRELGYVEGKNLIIEWRFADGNFERLPGLADELARLKVEVLVTHGTPPTAALQKATKTIPIVFAAVVDPVGSGFAASLAHPGGNITGTSIMSIDFSPKYLELLKLMQPKLSVVAVLMNPGSSVQPAVLKGIQAAAQQLRVRVLPVNARTAEEIEHGFAKMRQEHADATIVLTDTFFIGRRSQIAELALRHRLPSMFTFREGTLTGGLMSYGPSLSDSYRVSATYVDKILKGARPADLPIEQPTTLELVLNAKTAKELGLTIPQELRLRANEVIE